MNLRRIAILGAGGWGTALAGLWAKKGREVVLWANKAERAQQIGSDRVNKDYLPGVRLPDSLGLTSELADCADADLIVFATPSTALRTVAERLRDAGSNERAILLSCTKGIERGSGMRMSEILREIFPVHSIAVLSGPNLAPEIARDLPAATVVACADPEVTSQLQNDLGAPRFRIYSGNDLPGIELGGALKNVFAIAAGASDGLDLGDNSKAAVVTRSLAELTRLGMAMGGEQRTFSGLSGAGDLILTCFSQRSRNRQVGEQLARGKMLQEITSSMRMIAEGIPTTESAMECARRLKIDTPIIDQVYALLYQQKSAIEAMQELLRREQKHERF
jgi:glycerol-3-phosphate dehydrogenase (NAD(P)+)